METKITLFAEGLYHTGVDFEKETVHGSMVIFKQSFPSPLLGHETQMVAIKLEDVDKVIEFLQSVSG